MAKQDLTPCSYATGAYTLSEIGAYFGLHYATISRIARKASGG